MERIFIIASYKDDVKIETIFAPDDYRALLKWCKDNDYKFSKLLFNTLEIKEALRAQYGIELDITPLKELV